MLTEDRVLKQVPTCVTRGVHDVNFDSVAHDCQVLGEDGNTTLSVLLEIDFR
jgi:hypothetical protein